MSHFPADLNLDPRLDEDRRRALSHDPTALDPDEDDEYFDDDDEDLEDDDFEEEEEAFDDEDDDDVDPSDLYRADRLRRDDEELFGPKNPGY